MSKVYSIRRIETDDINIPDGRYHGFWSGYKVLFITPLGKFEGMTSIGVRGHDVPCEVVVVNNIANII